MILEKIQFITHQNDNYSYFDSALLALRSGIRFIQLRAKDLSDEEVVDLGKRILKECEAHDAIFIIDDRVELVEEIGAHGVHLGNEDMPTDKAREILGKDMIIGGTANSYKDILKHYKNGVDYIGLGPFRYTTTKEKLSPILGFDGYHRIIKKCKENNIEIPIYAIGGLRVEDMEELARTGIYGVALSSLLIDNDNPKNDVAKIQRLIK